MSEINKQAEYEFERDCYEVEESKMSESELKPCPFCGGEARHEPHSLANYGPQRPEMITGCERCGIWFDSIQRWNTRHVDPIDTSPKHVDETAEGKDGGELKPCPFCGHAMRTYRDVDGLWNVADTNNVCHFETGLVLSWEKEDEAIAAWNNRPTPAPAAPSKAVPVEKLRELSTKWRLLTDNYSIGDDCAEELDELIAKHEGKP